MELNPSVSFRVARYLRRVTYTISLPIFIVEVLREYAEASGEKINVIVTEAIAEWLIKHGFKEKEVREFIELFRRARLPTDLKEIVSDLGVGERGS